MAMHPKTMQERWKDSYLSSGNEGYLEDLYETYLSNPDAVAPDWHHYFDQLLKQFPREKGDVSHKAIREALLEQARFSSRTLAVEGLSTAHDQKQERVFELIDAYRRLGHLRADTDPLHLAVPTENPMLEITYYGFEDSDLNKHFSTGTFAGMSQETATLAQIHDALKRVYSSTIGFEYMHINRPDEVEWLRDRIEKGWAYFQPTKEEKLYLLNRLIVADGLEKYLGFKYVGQKRFSLEGGDSLIPLLDTLVSRGASVGVKEAIIGMAHRGRLNVLVNVVGQEPKKIFAAFEGTTAASNYSGDVKYHLGYAANVKTNHGTVHVALSFNPSHLEIVAPVVQGSVRARQRRRKDTSQLAVIPIQLHGDAAFAGQGVVMETFSMSQARWFKVGGSIHVVINNQIGFTTSDPRDSRSTIYCTDVAKMVEAPILHVNADDPEAVYFSALLAMDYRHLFKRDIVIDLVCYRRHGHNEADEPAATQPVMYAQIKVTPPTCTLYAKKLQAEGLIDAEWDKKIANDYRAALDAGKIVVDLNTDKEAYEYLAKWDPFVSTEWTANVETAIPLKRLKTLAHALAALPEGFVVQPQVKKVLEAQKKMTTGEVPINWGYAENLAYAALLDEGYPIRLCGQDSERGTFAHRHAVLHDQNTDQIYIPLSHLSSHQAHINLVDSFLSEEAVLAFEYGYASTEPNYLDIWEAQFGDFANGAQVVIDQFISSGEQKWQRLCGLVMYLPHGYEGQGPEHSSARLERYLQLCAQDNMQVCVPSTPAQIFHLIRRQMLRPYRKPLIVMTPKSLLRHPLATSALDDITNGKFQLIIPEVDDIKPKDTHRLILCTGKIYYDLLEARRKQSLTHVAIVRIEQLYPFPDAAYKKLLSKYEHVKEIIWCQEEPQNQGAWLTIQRHLASYLDKKHPLRYAGREAAASPAVGYHKVHEKEQETIVTQALLK